jgi:hypothetical protein
LKLRIYSRDVRVMSVGPLPSPVGAKASPSNDQVVGPFRLV